MKTGFSGKMWDNID